MSRRLSPAILLVALFVLAGATAARAQLVWTGATNSNAADISNYTGSLTSPQDVIYDDTAVGPTTDLYGSLGTLGTIYFTGSERSNYTFDNATLSLQNDIIVQPYDTGAPISFGSNYNITLTSTGHTIDVGSTNMEILGTIDDAGGYGATIYKEGGGSLTLSGANTFSGGVVVDAGTIYLGSSSYAPDGVYYGPVGTGILTLYNGTTLGVASSGGSISLDNNINLSADGGTVTFDTTNGDLTLNGFIGGPASVTKTGSGTLTLIDYFNNFNGGVTVQAGTLLLGGSSYFDGEIIQYGPVGTGDLTLWNGTTLGTAYYYGDITLDNNIVLDSGTVNIDTSNGNLTLNGIISENTTAGLALHGGGTLTVFGQNTYTGGTSVHDSSTLLLGSSSSASEGYIYYGPVGTGDLKLYDGATLGVASGVTGLTLDNNIALDCQSATSVNLDLSNLNGRWLELNGNISGAAAINLLDNYLSGGEIDLYGNNSSWTGGLNIYGNSIVYVGSDSGLGTGQLWFNSGSTAFVEFGSANPSIGGLSDSGAPNSEVSLDGSSLTINQAFDGSYSGLITGNGSIVKTGSATLTLSGQSTYSGGTTISAGKIVADGSTTVVSTVIQSGPLGTGAVTLNGGNLSVTSGNTLANPLIFASQSTLSGNGIIGTSIVADSMVIIAPGNSPGNLTFGAGLTLADGGTINFQVQDANGPAGTGYDLISVSGGVLNLTAGTNGLTFNLLFLNSSGLDGTPSNFNPASNYSWMFATSSSAITGFNPNQFQLVPIGTSGTIPGSFSFTESSDQLSLYLNFTPVPEPSTYALLALGLSMVALPVLRRRQRS